VWDSLDASELFELLLNTPASSCFPLRARELSRLMCRKTQAEADAINLIVCDLWHGSVLIANEAT
jgi:hypothetical protein